MIDHWTNDVYKWTRSTIGDSMNLTQVSKHLPFVLNESIQFYEKLKPGMRVSIKDLYRWCFVDILFKITFGENVLQNAWQFEYVDPFEIRPTVKGNLADLFERLIEDGYSVYFSMPYLIFPQLLKFGIGKRMKIMHQNSKNCLDSIMDYIKHENFESKMSIVS